MLTVLIRDRVTHIRELRELELDSSELSLHILFSLPESCEARPMKSLSSALSINGFSIVSSIGVCTDSRQVGC